MRELLLRFIRAGLFVPAAPCRSACAAAVGMLLGGCVGPLHLQLSSPQNSGRPVGGRAEGRPDERPAVPAHRQQAR